MQRCPKHRYTSRFFFFMFASILRVTKNFFIECFQDFIFVVVVFFCIVLLSGKDQRPKWTGLQHNCVLIGQRKKKKPHNSRLAGCFVFFSYRYNKVDLPLRAGSSSQVIVIKCSSIILLSKIKKWTSARTFASRSSASALLPFFYRSTWFTCTTCLKGERGS